MTRSREHDRFLDVMGDDDQRRLAVGPEVEQVVLQVDAGEGVERGERLVEQQHLRPRHQRAGERDPLRLPAESSRGQTPALSVSPTRAT